MSEQGRYNADDYTIEDYLLNRVNLDVSSSLVVPILLRRGVEPGSLLSDVDDKSRDLSEADFYVLLATTTPDRLGSESDTDNGWSHSSAGFTLSKTYRDLLLDKANALYEEYGEPTVAKRRFRMQSHGVQRARTGMDGEFLPHIIKD